MSAALGDENHAPAEVGKNVAVVKKETVFRGNWAPTLEAPLRFGPTGGRFIPVAPAIEPMGKLAETEEPKQKVKATGPPPGEDVHLAVYDRSFDYRACIIRDGRVLNAYHDLIGYISGTEAGSVSERYLGRVHATRFDNQYQVWAAAENNDEDLVATIDMGTHTVRHPSGGTAFDILEGGRIRSRNGTALGRFEGARGFHDMETIALYLLLVDPSFTFDDELGGW